MAHKYTIPAYAHFFRWIGRPIFRALFHILCTVKIQGRENIPSKGPYLVAINHVSLYEPPFIIAFWPRPLEAAGAVEIWNRKGQSWLVRLYGGIPVHRGQYDRQLLDMMLAAVEAGHPLLIAPEGGRTHTLAMRKALPGAAYIIQKANLPVVPVGILGTSDDFFPRILAWFKGHGPRPHLELRIGQPIQLPPIHQRGIERHQALQDNVDCIMTHIGALLPIEYHGYYAPQVAALHP